MALELLSGPSVIYNPDTGAPYSFASAPGCHYVDPRGLIVNFPGERRLVVQLDGAAYVVGQPRETNSSGITIVPALVLTNASATAPQFGERRYGGQEAGIFGTGRMWLKDRITLVDDQVVRESGPVLGLTGITLLHDRYLRLSGREVQTRSLESGGTWTVERALPLPSGSSAQWMSWAREPSRLWIGVSNGRVIAYDWVAKTEVGTAYVTGVANRGMFYSAKHDVFVSLHHDAGLDQCFVRVWARTPAPTVLSAPTALSAVNQGTAVRLRTRLTGANADPVADEVVGWSVTGDATLLAASTKTDTDGYAYNTLRVAQAAGASVTVDVEAVV